MTDSNVEPYLSVVVTTRNDDHGGDPLKRLQAFVNCFDEQCRRTGLSAEVIIVEWNPPPERPRLDSLVRLPPARVCTYRFIEVPPEKHQTLRYADVLPLFQMIAKNVGIRRARGRFVLVTNMDIIFSTEIIQYIASRQLQPGYLYRVDRHDIQSDFPVDAQLERQIAYCESHRLRVHTRWGSYPVDASGRHVSLPNDIVDGRTVRLGAGWHVREGAGNGGVFRWATDRAELVVGAGAGEDGGGPSVVEASLQSNPYGKDAWVEVAAIEGDQVLAQVRVAGSARLEIPIADAGREHALELRVVDAPPDARRQLPVFERRDAMHYRVSSVRVRPAAPPASVVPPPETFQYPVAGWKVANQSPLLVVNRIPGGLEIESDPRNLSYCVRYGDLQAPRAGTYRFELTCRIDEGGIDLSILSAGHSFWIPSTTTVRLDGRLQRFELEVDLLAGQRFSLVVSNRHPDGGGVSRFTIHNLQGFIDAAELLVEPLPAGSKLGLRERVDRLRYGVRSLRLSSGARPLPSSREMLVRAIDAVAGGRVAASLVRRSPHVQALAADVAASAEQLRELAPLGDFQKFLRDYRPDNLHLNGCGDFQLMAREHWFELRGYPELETFSMNIDGLFAQVADAAGIKERMIDLPIFHLEHEVGSGWSPEGEALLRKRIAERGITWLDASTVYIWAAQMKWLQVPMIFNGPKWGMEDEPLPEHTTLPSCSVTS